jgi:hypothetical protein
MRLRDDHRGVAQVLPTEPSADVRRLSEHLFEKPHRRGPQPQPWTIGGNVTFTATVSPSNATGAVHPRGIAARVPLVAGQATYSASLVQSGTSMPATSGNVTQRTRRTNRAERCLLTIPRKGLESLTANNGTQAAPSPRPRLAKPWSNARSQTAWAQNHAGRQPCIPHNTSAISVATQEPSRSSTISNHTVDPSNPRAWPMASETAATRASPLP